MVMFIQKDEPIGRATYLNGLEHSADTCIEKELIQTVSQLKRFFEKWQTDAAFRENLSVNPEVTLASCNFDIDLEAIRPLWDSTTSPQRDLGQADSSLIKTFKGFVEQFQPASFRDELLAKPTDLRFRAWRQRQMNRLASQAPCQEHIPIEARAIPVCFELSKGCSVGCWFCAVSAPKLGDLFTDTPENRTLWQQSLQLIQQILGPVAGAGFCYFATDPLDNPDYETFCSDFCEILGAFPQTTTALPLRNPERTRRLIALSKQKGQYHNRFSVLSIPMLNKIHAEFSAEELAFVGLEPRNQEAERSDPKVKAGRARAKSQQPAEVAPAPSANLLDGTISIITGFLFNMVERSVKLVSPCMASEVWPDGYQIYEQGTFTDIDSLRSLLEGMMTRHMPLTLEGNLLNSHTPITFRPDLQYRDLGDGFQLSTPFKTFTFRNSTTAAKVGAMIHESTWGAPALVDQLVTQAISANETWRLLNLLFEKGLLAE
jgi:radical SAM family RiPP maturation amino acid epimerase